MFLQNMTVFSFQYHGAQSRLEQSTIRFSRGTLNGIRWQYFFSVSRYLPKTRLHRKTATWAVFNWNMSRKRYRLWRCDKWKGHFGLELTFGFVLVSIWQCGASVVLRQYALNCTMHYFSTAFFIIQIFNHSLRNDTFFEMLKAKTINVFNQLIYFSLF